MSIVSSRAGPIRSKIHAIAVLVTRRRWVFPCSGKVADTAAICSVLKRYVLCPGVTLCRFASKQSSALAAIAVKWCVSLAGLQDSATFTAEPLSRFLVDLLAGRVEAAVVSEPPPRLTHEQGASEFYTPQKLVCHAMCDSQCVSDLCLCCNCVALKHF